MAERGVDIKKSERSVLFNYAVNHSDYAASMVDESNMDMERW
jgi:hypothetical protein